MRHRRGWRSSTHSSGRSRSARSRRTTPPTPNGGGGSTHPPTPADRPSTRTPPRGRRRPPPPPPPQQRAALRLVSSGLSVPGYVTVATIIGLENVLDHQEGF